MDFVKPIAVLFLSYFLTSHSEPLSEKSSEHSLRGGRGLCGQYEHHHNIEPFPLPTIIETRPRLPLPLAFGTGFLPPSFDYRINSPIAHALIGTGFLPPSFDYRINPPIAHALMGTGFLPPSFDYRINPSIAHSLMTPSFLPSSLGEGKIFFQNPYTFGYPISRAVPIPVTLPFASLAPEYPLKSPLNVTFDGEPLPLQNKTLSSSKAKESPKFNYTLNHFVVPSPEDSTRT